jgi:hypothetical protein
MKPSSWILVLAGCIFFTGAPRAQTRAETMQYFFTNLFPYVSQPVVGERDCIVSVTGGAEKYVIDLNKMIVGSIAQSGSGMIIPGDASDFVKHYYRCSESKAQVCNSGADYFTINFPSTQARRPYNAFKMIAQECPGSPSRF